MDVQDASNVGQYAQALVKQKEILRSATKRDGEIPTDRKSRQRLIDEFMLDVQAMRQDKRRHLVYSSFVPPPYLPSTVPYKALSPIYISQLKLGIHHRGKYLLVKAITPPIRMAAIMAIVEDEHEDALIVQLYQQPDESVLPATSIINEGDVFLLKEPFMKVMSDGGYGLRVDHVNDLIRINSIGRLHSMMPSCWAPSTTLIRTANDLKQQGNREVGRKEYWSAIRTYDTASRVSKDPVEQLVIQLNRALACLKNGNFDEAILNTQSVDAGSSAEKALYRMGQACYSLGHFDRALEINRTLNRQFPDNDQAPMEINRCLLRCKERVAGIYSFKSMYREADKLRPPHLDRATYNDPVETRNSPGRGSGLFTMKNVKAGDILLCEKAFAHCSAAPQDKKEGSSKISILINTNTDRITIGTQGDLITKIAQTVAKNPSLIPIISKAYHGSYQPTNETICDGEPVVDTFLIERIVALNVFGCPSISTYDDRFKNANGNDPYDSTGLWLKAATINHACLSNCRRSFIGDMMIIRATCDIPANTELFHWYWNPTGDYEEMKKGLGHWGFECTCAICNDAKTTSKKICKRRNDLFADLKTNLAAGSIDTVKCELLLKKIDETYTHPSCKVPRLLGHWSAYLKLAQVYSNHQKPSKCVAQCVKALETLGFIIKGAQLPATSGQKLSVEKWGIMADGVIQAWITMCDAYRAFAPGLLAQAEDFARRSYGMCIGEEGTFEKHYRRVPSA